MPKQNGVTTSSASPKTVLDKVVYAIRNQPPNSNGVSRTAIAKYLKSELDCDNATAIKKAMKKGIDTGVLVQNGQSFRVAKDPIVEPEPEPKVDIQELQQGKGSEEAEKGDTVTVKYAGFLSDGTLFDSETSFEFTLGNGDVIKGWDAGLLGMKVGGKRKLIVPPKLGYGKRGCGPDIPPNSTLHFEITLKKLKRPLAE